MVSTARLRGTISASSTGIATASCSPISFIPADGIALSTLLPVSTARLDNRRLVAAEQLLSCGSGLVDTRRRGSHDHSHSSRERGDAGAGECRGRPDPAAVVLRTCADSGRMARDRRLPGDDILRGTRRRQDRGNSDLAAGSNLHRAAGHPGGSGGSEHASEQGRRRDAAARGAGAFALGGSSNARLHLASVAHRREPTLSSGRVRVTRHRGLSLRARPRMTGRRLLTAIRHRLAGSRLRRIFGGGPEKPSVPGPPNLRQQTKLPPTNVDAVLVWTRLGNTGDHLIGDACERFLRDRGMTLWRCDGSIEEAALANDTEYLGDFLSEFRGPVFFFGGGSIGIFEDNERIRASVLAQFVPGG